MTRAEAPAERTRAARAGCLLAGALIFLCPKLPAGGPGSGTANFLKMGVGGRGVAMGDAQTADAPDATALYWNPAGLGNLRQKEVSFMRNAYLQGTRQDVLYYVHPVRGGSSLGAGLSVLRVPDIAGYDSFGAKTGDFSASDTLLTLGWGKSWENLPWLPGLSTGANIKYLRKDLMGEKASVPLLDLGLIYEAREGPFRRLRTGLAAQNLGGGLKFDGETSDLPGAFKAGLAYPILGETVALTSDLVFPSDDETFLNVGGEYRLWDLLFFRLGYKGRKDLDAGLTYGAGFGNERLRVDYAFIPFGDLGDSHRVSLGFRFGRDFARARIQDQIRRAYAEAASFYARGRLVDAYLQASQIQNVAPWHVPSKTLMHKVRRALKDEEDAARREKLQAQIDEHYRRGVENFRQDRLVSAKQEFEAVFALDPGHEGAKTHRQEIDGRFSNMMRTFYESGMRYFAAGDYAMARDEFRKALVLKPAHAEARAQLTRAEKLLGREKGENEKRGQADAARASFVAALDAFQREDFAGALANFEETLRLDPGHEDAARYRLLCRDVLARERFEKGTRAAQAGDRRGAEENFKAALGHKPDYAPAKDALSRLDAQSDPYKKRQSQLLYQRGLEALLTREPDKAADLWRQALELDPDNAPAARGLSRLR
ncbi:MAG: PorV/PorQ family protein [Elusimicrobiota bacterium]